MPAYKFRRGCEIAITVEQDGRNLPGGFLWEPIGRVEPCQLRTDIAHVLQHVGFFIWP